MTVARKIKYITHRKKRYKLEMLQRPFREGLEVVLHVGGVKIPISEFGYGEQALQEKVRAEIDAVLARRASEEKT